MSVAAKAAKLIAPGGTSEGTSPISTLYGNTRGLKPSDQRALERTYRRKVSPEQVVTSELTGDDEHDPQHGPDQIAASMVLEVAGAGHFGGDVDHRRNHPVASEVRRDLKRWVPEFHSQVRPRLTAIPQARTG